MKKLFSIILTAAVLCIVGSGTAWGQSAIHHADSVSYYIEISGQDCWYNPNYVEEQSKENDITITVWAQITSTANDSSPKQSKTVTVTLGSEYSDIMYNGVSAINSVEIIFGPNDIPSVDFASRKIEAKVNEAATEQSILGQPYFGAIATAELSDGSTITTHRRIRKATAPTFNPTLRPEVVVIEAVDSISSKGGFMTFMGDNMNIAEYPNGIQITEDHNIGWSKATPVTSSLKDIDIPLIGYQFKALENPDTSYYTYKTDDGCDIDTTLKIAVWIKKDYKPQLATRSIRQTSSGTLPAGSLDGCFYKLNIENLPYIKDITDVSGTEIDTIQTNTVYVEVLKRNELGTFEPIDEEGEEYEDGYIPESYPYNQEWKNDNHQKYIVLKGGNRYQIKYTYKYIHAQSPKNDSVFIYQFGLPHAFNTVNDHDTVTTSTPAIISPLENDTISGCLDYEDFRLEAKAQNGTYYNSSGSTPWGDTIKTRHGFLFIREDETKPDDDKRRWHFEYTSNKDYMGYDTIRYRIQDMNALNSNDNTPTTTYVNVKEVYLRVNPSYELEVSKQVTHIDSRKGDRRTTNLDTVFTGDTVYFEVKVKNSGKNRIRQAFEVRDTFPKSMRFPFIDEIGNTLLNLAMPDFANINGAMTTFGCHWDIPADFPADSSVVYTFGLIARGSSSLLDTNKLYVEATTSLFPGEGIRTGGRPAMSRGSGRPARGPPRRGRRRCGPRRGPCLSDR